MISADTLEIIKRKGYDSLKDIIRQNPTAKTVADIARIIRIRND